MSISTQSPAQESFMRIDHIVGNPDKGITGRFPVSRSEWYRGIKEGRFPKGINLSANIVAWRTADIDALIASFLERK